MPNPIFDRGQGSPVSRDGGIFSILFERKYQSDPEFRDFANSMRGKTMEQACREKGVNPAQLLDARNNPQRFLSQFGMFGR